MIGVVDGVAHPRDVVDVVFLTFVEGDVDIHLVVLVGHHTVADDLGVAIAQLVVFLDDAAEVVAIVLLHKLLLAEELPQVAPLVGLLDDALEFAVAEHLVAVDIDLVHLHLAVLVDVDVDKHLVFIREVLLEGDFHIGFAESLLRVVLLDDIGGAVHDILRDLVALHELQALLDVVALPFFHAVVVHIGDARLRTHVDHEPHLVAGYLVDKHLCLGEKSLAHQSLHGSGDLIARQLHLVALFEARVAYHYVVFVVVGTGDTDVGHFVDRRHAGVHHRRIVYGVGAFLSA